MGLETVTRLRPVTAVDAYGDLRVTGYAELDVPGCVVAPRMSVENNEGLREGIPLGVDVYAPYPADFEATDHARTVDGRTWRVDGEPARWSHPVTGRRPGTVVRLTAWEG